MYIDSYIPIGKSDNATIINGFKYSVNVVTAANNDQNAN